MKTFVNFILRFLVKVALHLYFHKIYVEGKENIPKDKPVILVANHQNALIDPLLIATHTQLKPYFLTRAAAFKNPLISKMLHFIRMLPVYRVRDGFSSIQKNESTFSQTFKILKDNGTVIIFAEGNHSLERHLRPLSKGFTRMAFGVKEMYPNIEPVILPVGINFSAHKRSGSIVRLIFGESIPVDMSAKETAFLTKKVHSSIKKLTVDIPSDNYEIQLKVLLEERVDLSSPSAVSEYYETHEVKSPIKEPSSIPNKLMKIYHFPLLLLWLWVKPKIDDIVFYSTFKFLIGFCFALLWYSVLILLSLKTSIGSWAIAILILAAISLWLNKNMQE